MDGQAKQAQDSHSRPLFMSSVKPAMGSNIVMYFHVLSCT